MRRNECGGKIRYETIGAARQAVVELVRKNGRKAGEGPMSAYSCSFCQGFHVGHTPYRLRRRVSCRRRRAA